MEAIAKIHLGGGKVCQHAGLAMPFACQREPVQRGIQIASTERGDAGIAHAHLLQPSQTGGGDAGGEANPFIAQPCIGRQGSRCIRPVALRNVFLQFAFAWLERQSRYNLADVSLKATTEGSGWSLSGHKGVVYNAPAADDIIVLARTSGAAREQKGLTLFVVDAKAKGITRRDYPTQDALRASELTFDKVSVGADAVLGSVDGAFPLVEAAVDRAIVALCAEATGCMDAINAATFEYIKTRKQFGVPIGKF